MKTLLTVMAHAEAQDTFDRHRMYWERHGFQVVVMCPIDSVVRTNHPLITIGRKSHHDAEANRRFKALLADLSKTSYDRFVIHEYDSLCFQDMHPQFNPDGVWSNLFTDDDPKWQGHHFLHPPLVMSREILTRVVETSRSVPDGVEHGFWDRMLGFICERGSIPMHGYGERGFSKNTILPSDIPAAVAARKAGAIMFHGVKSIEVLKALTEL
jgi:hypothetical protein